MARGRDMVAAIGMLAKAAFGYAPSFRGRATRYELAMTALLCLGAGMVAAVVGVFGPFEASVTQAVLSGLVIVMPLIAVIVRRLHDTNRSAAALLVLLTPYVGIVILAVILLVEGNEFDNNSGPNPRIRRRW